MKLKNSKKNSGFTLVELLVVIAIIAGLAAISSPIIIKQIAKARATQAINNAKDIYVGLRDMSMKTGQPLPIVKAGTYTSGSGSNEILGEVFYQGFLEDEKPFYVKGVVGAVEGDGDIATSILEQNSNVFTYFENGNTGLGINPVTAVANTPLLSSPNVTATGTAFNVCTYNTAAYGNQAVVLRADGSVSAYNLSPTFFIADATAVVVDDKAGSRDLGADCTGTIPDFATAQVN